MAMSTHASRGPVDPEHYHPDNKRQRVVAYIILGAIFVSLALIALGTFRHAKSSVNAHNKGNQLITDLTNAGFHAPTIDQITKVFGEDGGALCESPSSALKVGLERIGSANGAGGPGLRPVYVAKRVVEAELIAINVYCPEHAPAFKQYVEDYKNKYFEG
jgi:hypothetical protein